MVSNASYQRKIVKVKFNFSPSLPRRCAQRQFRKFGAKEVSPLLLAKDSLGASSPQRYSTWLTWSGGSCLEHVQDLKK
jgi:hypothetical protein